MDCKRDRETLTAYVDGELEGAARAELESHLAGCAACSDAVAAQRRLGAMFAALPEVTPAGDFEARFWARIAREREPAGFGARLRSLFTARGALALGAAAVVALVLALALPRSPSQPSDSTGAETAAAPAPAKPDPDVRIVSNPKDFQLLQDPDMDAIADVDVLEAWDDASPG
jgi:anti-sigma factor RsiW